jgi:serine/threonine-protein kinase
LVGTTINHFKVIEKIGQGGMGEVYRAEDTNLSREVAIKVLPEQFTQDPQRLARFEREAKLLASLNHPNIAAIHSFEHADDVHFLVLELVPGETLQERVAKGPVPVEEALEVCRQIAEGVEAAHAKGVIHRDLKPANVKVTPEGKVKILDFGLAKAFEEEISPADMSQSPTLTEEMTRAGVILGTAAYMSPEQAKGKPVDKRADIFAFGAVLYELLTGKRTFEGETITETIASVLKSEPDWEKLPGDTPGRIKELLEDCLQKDPHDRLHNIANVRIQIKKALSEPATVSPNGPTMATQPAPLRRTITLGLAVLAGAALGVTIWSLMRSPFLPPATLKQLVIQLPSTAPLAVETWRPAVAFSPDGSRLVYVANRDGTRQLYLRQMDRLEATPIPGTEGGHSPFFSPDGQSVGFIVGYDLKKVSVSGGAPEPLAHISPVTRGASWGPDDTIIFTPSQNGGLSRTSAVGNAASPYAFSDASSHPMEAQILTTPDPTKGEYSHRWSQFLPGGKTVLFTIDTGGSFDEARIGVLSLETGKVNVLLDGGTNARYSPTGHIVFSRAGALLAVPFDLERLERTGDPVTVVEGILMEPGGAAHFTFSDDGSLAYVPGAMLVPDRKLVWVNRQGEVDPLPAEAREYMHPSLSPDGKQLAVTIREGSNYDVWVSEVERGSLGRLTSHPGEDFAPIWTPDGKQVTFASEMTGTGPILWWRPADASGPQELLLEREEGRGQYPSSWSPDGQTLAFTDLLDPVKGQDIWMLPLEGKQEPWAFLDTEFEESGAMFSPDGRLLAYTSNETGRDEVYLQPFSVTGPRGTKQVSVGGGAEPLWAPDSRELFYRDGDKMMAVAIETEPELSVGTPRLLFEGRFLPVLSGDEPGSSYDISPDGERFLMIQREQDLVPTEIIVILNWFEELKRLVPTN